MSMEQVYVLGIPFVVALLAIEVIIAAVRDPGLYERGDTAGSLGMLAGNILVSAAVKGLMAACFFWVYEYRPWTLSAILPGWALWVSAFVLLDLTFYWFHRMSHRVNFLWAIHMNHHSSEHMNFVVAFRQPWLAPIVKIPFFAVVPLLGVDPTVALAAGAASTLWGVTGHTRIIDRLGPLEWIFNTPSHHRVHHGTNPEYLDKNFGNLLIIWDRMFGTFEPERSPVRYGLTRNLGTNNPWRITWHGWRKTIAAMRSSDSTRQALRMLFGPPEVLSEVLGAPSEDPAGDIHSNPVGDLEGGALPLRGSG